MNEMHIPNGKPTTLNEAVYAAQQRGWKPAFVTESYAVLEQRWERSLTGFWVAFHIVGALLTFVTWGIFFPFWMGLWAIAGITATLARRRDKKLTITNTPDGLVWKEGKL